jgi:uncharacterized membrane protein
MRLAIKTTSYGVVHIMAATTIAYLMTGTFAVTLGIGIIEPVVQTGVYAVHDRLWERGLSSPKIMRFAQ